MHELPGGLRQQRRAAVREPPQAGGPVERGAEVVAAALVRLARVEGHAHAQVEVAVPRHGGERLAQGGRALERVGGAREHAEGRVALALRLEEATAVRLGGALDQLVVQGERRRHGVRIGLPQRGRALDVRHQERHDAGRERGPVARPPAPPRPRAPVPEPAPARPAPGPARARPPRARAAARPARSRAPRPAPGARPGRPAARPPGGPRGTARASAARAAAPWYGCSSTSRSSSADHLGVAAQRELGVDRLLGRRPRADPRAGRSPPGRTARTPGRRAARRATARARSRAPRAPVRAARPRALPCPARAAARTGARRAASGSTCSS